MLRRALVAMDGSVQGTSAGTLAIDWGRQYGAELVGLGVLDAPSITGGEPVPLGGSAFKHARDEARLADAHGRIVSFLEAFRHQCDAAGVRCSVVEDVGTPHEQIVAEAQGCDLVILGKETNFQFETPNRHDATLSKVLRLSPRPVVVVPGALAPGHGILVAYGGGREVARTLEVFTLLGLAGAEPVEIVAVDRDVARAEIRLRPAATLLRAHGIECRLNPVASDAAPAAVVLDEVRRRQPRLLVMGSHGHHPVHDLFFTSVTRAVLRDCPVPVFVGA